MMSNYKVFNEGMTINGQTFEEQKTYSENVDLFCDAKLNYCDNAADMLIGSDFIDFDTCKANLYAKVTPLSGIHDDTGKDCMYKHLRADKLKVGRSLTYCELASDAASCIKSVARAVGNTHGKKNEFVQNDDFASSVMLSGKAPMYENTASENRLVCTSERLTYAGFGSYPLVVCDGEAPVLSSSGSSGTFVLRGDYASVAAAGGYDRIMNLGNYSKIACVGGGDEVLSEGEYAKIVCLSGHSRIVTNGNNSTVLADGNEVFVSSRGTDDIVVNLSKDGAAKGNIGTFLTLAEYKEDNDGNLSPINVITQKIDGIKLLPDTWYTLVEGQFRAIPE